MLKSSALLNLLWISPKNCLILYLGVMSSLFSAGCILACGCTELAGPQSYSWRLVRADDWCLEVWNGKLGVSPDPPSVITVRTISFRRVTGTPARCVYSSAGTNQPGSVLFCCGSGKWMLTSVPTCVERQQFDLHAGCMQLIPFHVLC